MSEYHRWTRLERLAMWVIGVLEEWLAKRSEQPGYWTASCGRCGVPDLDSGNGVCQHCGAELADA